MTEGTVSGRQLQWSPPTFAALVIGQGSTPTWTGSQASSPSREVRSCSLKTWLSGVAQHAQREGSETAVERVVTEHSGDDGEGEVVKFQGPLCYSKVRELLHPWGSHKGADS